MYKDIQTAKGTDAAELRDNKNYFVEKGGSYFKDDKCKLCSYQQGCFYPKDPVNDKTNIRKMYHKNIKSMIPLKPALELPPFDLNKYKQTKKIIVDKYISFKIVWN